METGDGERIDVLSELADLRGIPLQEIPTLAAVTIDKVVERVLPRSSGAPASGVAFSSAI